MILYVIMVFEICAVYPLGRAAAKGGKKMHVVPGFVVREIAGETIAIPAGPAARELSGLLALNGSGAFLFDLLQSEQTEQSLVQAMLDSYEIDQATAAADVAEFLEILRSNSILIENESNLNGK